jgi:GTP-binding protein EngB required for normal cell division
MLTANSNKLISWYEEKVRPFLVDILDEEKIEAFDKDNKSLKRATELSKTELSVCFLGNSGVGKSTLINAVIDGHRAVVPSGGVGPLTAQALVVRHNEQAGFEVEYHTAGQLLRTVFGLEQMYKSELGKPELPQDDLESSEELEEADLVEVDPPSGSDNVPDPTITHGRLEKRQNLCRRAQLLVAGSQDEERELKYLLDSLREAAGGKRLWGTKPAANDAERILGIQHALRIAKKKQTYTSLAKNDSQFTKKLHDHATGFLAPMIKRLELNWDTPILRKGITFVDLPGVGVMRDVHRDVTRYWIREKANALVLIVDHRGLNDSVAEALRQSEFLNSLLYSADEPEDDPVVMVAVTRIDDIANERYQQNRTKKKIAYFLDVVAEARDKLRREMQQSLESIWLSEEDIPESRRKVVKNLLSKLQVHPVSAPEYARIMAADGDDPSFLRDPEQSGIPLFTQSIVELAAERKNKAHARLKRKADLFQERLIATLSLIQSQWESDIRAQDEIKELKEDLELFMAPLRKELHVRQGAYRTFLRKTVPDRIEDLVETASLKASVQINRYLLKLGSAHWATLKASVRRGGRYSGASDINLPSEFALRFEEPIAEMWAKEILADIRKETRDYAADCVDLVERVTDWALAQGARVQPRMIEAQRDSIKSDAKKLTHVGREMVKELRDEAKEQLINHIEGPIKRRCAKFVKDNEHIGRGVKQRILNLYSELADKVTEAAKEPATLILQKLFKDVEQEIVDAFKEHENPLDAVAEAIASAHGTYRKRSDAQKRSRILEQLNLVKAEAPQQDKVASHL